MKRSLVVLGVVLMALALSVAIASASPPAFPPGQGECQHGNSGQECREDPQPDHGQDCEEHGNHGGVNEDHCDGTSSTPTPSPSPPIQPTPTLIVDPAPTPSVGVTPEASVLTQVSHPGTLARTGPSKGVVLIGVIGLAFFLVGLTLREIGRK